MNHHIRFVQEPFPEPGFSELQQEVFADIQQESASLAAVIDSEYPARQAVAQAPAAKQPPMVRFGAFADETLIGWSCGWFERGNTFYMASSGISPIFRRQGVYSRLLQAVVLHAQEAGALVIRSQHSILNNPVIICKLQRGFHIAGLSSSAQMGTLVELVLHLSQQRRDLFRNRVVPLVAPT
jgi:GNAT superfamily N-acetyltransferase